MMKKLNERSIGNIKKRNQEKGITLIALVVTIIVLLILAGISISMLTGQNGILSRAGEAKIRTEEAQTDDLVKLAVMSAMSTGLGEIKNTEILNKALEDSFGTGEYELAGDEITGWMVTIGDKVFSIDKDGKTGEVNWIQKADGTIQSVKDETVTLKIGDYINYDPTNGGTLNSDAKCQYTAPQGTYVASNAGQDGGMEFGTGVEGADGQVFTLDSNTKWKVMGIENGKIMLISANTLSKTLSLRGQTGYQYGPEIVNNISKIYGYGEGAEGARAITVEDINKVTGYDPEKEGNVEGAAYQKGQVYEYGNKVTYKNNGSRITYQGTKQPAEETTSGYSMFRYYDETSKTWKSLARDEERVYTSNSYYYYPKTLTTNLGDTQVGKITNNEYSTLFNFSGGSSYYWLGSRCVSTDTGYAHFGLRFVSSGNGVDYRNLCASSGNTLSGTRGVRPVVSLKSDIQLEPSGTANQWNIVK